MQSCANDERSYNPACPKTAKKELQPAVGGCELIGSRRNMEDVRINAKIKGGHLWGVFDGHGGPDVSKHAANYYLTRFQIHSNATDADVIGAFKRADIEIQETCPPSGGSTAIICYDAGSIIYFNNLGDSRALLFNKKSGKILRMDYYVVDNASNKRRNVSNGDAMTDIHQMPGLAERLPEYGPQITPITLDDMHTYRIMNDDDSESAKREWMSYCQVQFEQKKITNPGLNSNTFVVPIPYHSAGDPLQSFRLCEDGIQPTRGSGNEDTNHIGEVYVFDCF